MEHNDLYTTKDGTLVKMLKPEDPGLFQELYPNCALVRNVNTHERMVVPAVDLKSASSGV